MGEDHRSSHQGNCSSNTSSSECTSAVVKNHWDFVVSVLVQLTKELNSLGTIHNYTISPIHLMDSFYF